MFVHIINRPCGHSMADDCEHVPMAGQVTTTTQAQIYNGLCYCRGPFDLHPFHTGKPLPPEYVGRHRDPKETP